VVALCNNGSGGGHQICAGSERSPKFRRGPGAMMAGEGVVLAEACGSGLWATRRHVRGRRSDRGEGVYDPRGGVGYPMDMDDAQLRWALAWRVAGGDRC
jgi:hypothetical protein